MSKQFRGRYKPNFQPSNRLLLTVRCVQMTTHAQAPPVLAPRMTRTANLNPGLGWPEVMQVQLSKQHRRRALDIISNSGSKIGNFRQP
jgi:hypothetical protein